MNWGGFAAGLGQGVEQGIALGKGIRALVNEKRMEDLRAEGVAEAQAARARSIDSAIQEVGQSPQSQEKADQSGPAQSQAAAVGITGQPTQAYNYAALTPAPESTQNTAKPAPAVGESSAALRAQDATPASKSSITATTPSALATGGQTSTPSTAVRSGLPYVVNGKSYATRDEARAAAEKSVPDIMHFMRNTLVPKMQQAYIEQGHIDKAEDWGKWSEDRDNKAAMKEWAGAFRAAQIGDIGKAADHIFELYKRHDDGITPISKEKVTDNSGNITGFNVRLKNGATGEEYSQFVDRKALIEIGLSALSPQAMFETQYKRQAEAENIAAKVAAENARDDRNFRQDIYKQDRAFGQQARRDDKQQSNAIELRTVESQLQDANASKKLSKEIEAKVSALRGDLFADRLKNDFSFGSKSSDEQSKIIDQDMAIVLGKGGAMQPQSRPTEPAPRSSAPTPNKAKPSSNGVPVYDPKTGKIIYR